MTIYESLENDSNQVSHNITYNNYEFFEFSLWWLVFLYIAYILISLFAIVSNAMILFIVFGSLRMKRSVINMFIANMSFSDLITGALVIPFQFQAALLQKWILPYFMCSLCPTVQIITLNVSIFTLIAIALDRHHAVHHPLKAKTSKSRSNIIIVIIWIFSILISVPTLIAYKIEFILDETTDLRTKPYCNVIGIDMKIWKIYNYILAIIQYFLPLIIISYAYISMANLLQKKEAPKNHSLKTQENKKQVSFIFELLI